MVTEEDESLLTSKEVTIYSSQATRTCQHNTDKQVCGMNSHPELGGGGKGPKERNKANHRGKHPLMYKHMYQPTVHVTSWSL